MSKSRPIKTFFLTLFISLVVIIAVIIVLVIFRINSSVNEIRTVRSQRDAEYSKITLPPNLVQIDKKEAGDLIDTGKLDWGWLYTYSFTGDPKDLKIKLISILEKSGYQISEEPKSENFWATNTNGKLSLHISFIPNKPNQLYISLKGIE